MKKKTTAQKKTALKKKCDELWSKAVRLRDGRCLLCGKTDGLAAHHYIQSRARSLLHRHNVKNGITLCFACHIYKVHTDATTNMLEQVKRAAIGNNIATEAEIEAISNDRSICQLNLEDLEIRKAHLEDYIEELERGKTL